MNEQQRTIAFFGGLLHDIGGVLMQENISLADLALSAGQVASAGAALLRSFPVTLPFAPAKVFETNLMEENEREVPCSSAGFAVTLKPFEVKTFRIVLN